MSNIGSRLPSVTGYDYVQDTQPPAPEAGETWFDTPEAIGKVWTGSTWVEESAPAGGAGITLLGRQYDVAVGSGVQIDTGAVAIDPTAAVTSVNGATGDVSVSQPSSTIDAGVVGGYYTEGGSSSSNISTGSEPAYVTHSVTPAALSGYSGWSFESEFSDADATVDQLDVRDQYDQTWTTVWSGSLTATGTNVVSIPDNTFQTTKVDMFRLRVTNVTNNMNVTLNAGDVREHLVSPHSHPI